jgi:hypothetical protein
MQVYMPIILLTRSWMTLARDFELTLIKMKTLIITALLIALARSVLTEDFLQGFETGVYVRNDDRAYRDHNCPKPEASDQFAKQV